ncbi:hypothetical protein P4S73_17975 [Paraglaciecola sp. Hal342]
MIVLVLFISLIVLIAIGTPVAFALILSSLLAISLDGDIPNLVVLHSMVGG